MAKRNYRSAVGKTIDMEALRMANERSPAIGNMNVNARGDQINSQGGIVRTREQIMQDHYKLNTMVPTDEPVLETAPPIEPDEVVVEDENPKDEE
tara:strand:+ start:188 stop:472 length:285 start_codon:yes stop_codon:yes gene_type:complete